MRREVQHKIGTETVTVHVTILEKFQECKEDMKSPFKFMQRGMPEGFNPNHYENVFVKCEIHEGNRIMAMLSHRVSGESVCHEVVQDFVEQCNPDAELNKSNPYFVTTMNCNIGTS